MNHEVSTRHAPALFAPRAQKKEVATILFNRLFDSNIIGILVGDVDGNITEANDALLAMIGYSRDDLINGRVQWRQLTPPEFAECDARAIAQIRESGACTPYEKIFLHRDGRRVPILIGASMLPPLTETDREESICFVLDLAAQKAAEQQASQAARQSNEELEQRVAARTAELEQANRELQAEVARRKQAETDLRRINERLELAQAAANIGTFDWNLQTNQVDWSASEERLFGLPPGGFEGKYENWRKRVHPEDLAATEKEVLQAATMMTPLHVHYRIIRSDGAVRWIEAQAQVLSDEHNQPSRMIGVNIDITERRQAEGRIREQAALLDHAQDAIFLRTVTGHILYWSHGATRLFGYTAAEAVGQRVQDLIYRHAPDQFEQANQYLLHSESGSWLDELRPMTKDGREVIVERRWTLLRDEDGAPQSVLVIMTDVTEKKRIEEQYLRAQRLESIGSLAAGVAHDLNNIFSPLLLASHLLKPKCDDPQSWRHLNMIINNTRRGCSMVQQVLGFARGSAGEAALFQPKHVIKEIAHLLKEIFPPNIEIKAPLPGDLWCLTGDSTKLHQVLVNLCVNARDAMPDGGLLQIQAENVELDATYAQMRPAAQPGGYVRVSVSDTGIGIAPEALEKIFDPFFTSKTAGKGTGLGLATVKAIVGSFHGFLHVNSQLGAGTTFDLFFPATSAAEQQPGEEKETELPAGRGELVLVASKEAALREIVEETLATYGYRVLQTGDGAEAVSLLAQHHHEVQIVLTDPMLPTLAGAALLRAINRIAPQAKIIIQIDTDAAEHHAPSPATFNGVEQIYKPYTAHHLLKLLANLLHKPALRALV
jgi:PAS domain S-box-containing protein